MVEMEMVFKLFWIFLIFHHLFFLKVKINIMWHVHNFNRYKKVYFFLWNDEGEKDLFYSF